MADNVFIAFQNNAEAQPIIEAIAQDNPNAVLSETAAAGMPRETPFVPGR